LYRLNFSSQVTTGIFSHKAWAMICVLVVWGEIEKRERMMRRVGRYAEVQILKRAARVRFRKS
jgi:hypothetical protein